MSLSTPTAGTKRKRAQTEQEKEEKRLERILKNRQSAARSRQRQLDYMAVLEQENFLLKEDNERVSKRLKLVEDQNSCLQSKLAHMENELAVLKSLITQNAVASVPSATDIATASASPIHAIPQIPIEQPTRISLPILPPSAMNNSTTSTSPINPSSTNNNNTNTNFSENPAVVSSDQCGSLYSSYALYYCTFMTTLIMMLLKNTDGKRIRIPFASNKSSILSEQTPLDLLRREKLDWMWKRMWISGNGHRVFSKSYSCRPLPKDLAAKDQILRKLLNVQRNKNMSKEKVVKQLFRHCLKNGMSKPTPTTTNWMLVMFLKRLSHYFTTRPNQ